ncbi:MAG: DNA cytosine methyltransferase [Methylobacterium radiotolerans]
MPSELRLKCHASTHGFPDVYGRMKWDDVAPTLTTGCTDVTRGRFAHPDQDRAITLREAALLQTFPRKYIFHGPYNRVTTQIGNAVPVAMVSAMVPALVEALAAV